MILTDWHTCPELEPLLQALRGSAGDRILRLFACGCARQVWPLLERESGTRPDLLRAAELAVATAEGFADGVVPRDQLFGVRATTQARFRDPDGGMELETAWSAALATTCELSWDAAVNAAEDAAGAMAWDANTPTAWMAARARQVTLLRCLVDPPFCPRPRVHPDWLGWQNGAIPALARAIYDERAFDRFPVLGDMFEEVGCTDPAILDHCRQHGEHGRGCRVLDLILGRG